jgi:hypothetical protein
MKRSVLFLSVPAAVALWGCGGSKSNNTTEQYTNMDGAAADCQYDTLTFKTSDGTLHEVQVNGLAVESLAGANKVTGSDWQVVERRGVRFSVILTKGDLSADDATPVNFIGRDGFDPLREMLSSNVTKLPHFDFVRDHGYVYIGSPGTKDPMYPLMEDKSLFVDYEAGADSDVPAYLGASLSGLGKFRCMMLEKVDEEHHGIVEINPVVQ